MSNLSFLQSIDVEDTVREALSSYFTIYCRPLPKNFSVPSLLVTSVGGDVEDKVDTFDITLDARAKTDAEANELLRQAVGVLVEIGKTHTTPVRNVQLNTLGSWGNDPVRPDLSMYSARLRITAHQEIKTL